MSLARLSRLLVTCWQSLLVWVGDQEQRRYREKGRREFRDTEAAPSVAYIVLFPPYAMIHSGRLRQSCTRYSTMRALIAAERGGACMQPSRFDEWSNLSYSYSASPARAMQFDRTGGASSSRAAASLCCLTFFDLRGLVANQVFFLPCSHITLATSTSSSNYSLNRSPRVAYL